jgi:alpha-tubulin suppressor-like RCC1 family protein
VVAFERNINKVPVPPPSSGLDSIAEVAAGDQHVALRTRSGQVVLWAGPKVFGSARDSEMVAKLGDPATNVTSIASGSHTVIALTDRGEVLCSGQLNNLCTSLAAGLFWNTTPAGSVGGNQTVRAIRAGANNWFFVQLDDVNRTWVRNDGLKIVLSRLHGRPRPGNDPESDSSESVGDGEVKDLLVLNIVNEFPSLILATFKGGGYALSIADDDNTQLPDWIRDTAIASVCTVVGTNPRHVAALLSNGSVAVWANSESLPDLPELQPPPGLGIDNQSRATSLACGTSHISVTLANGKSLAWGKITRDGLLEPQGGGSMVLTATAAGEFHSVYLSRSGNVYMAGTMEATAPNPLPDALLTPSSLATQVAAGEECAVALLHGEGGAVAWGSTTSGVSNVPPTLRSYPVVQVAAGERHALALLADGSVVAWGAATVAKAKLPNVSMVAIAAAGQFGAAVAKDDARLLVWGSFFHARFFNCDQQNWMQDQVRPMVVTGVAEISARGMSVAVLLKDGSVLANGCSFWNLNSSRLDQYTGNVSAVAASGVGVLLLLLESGRVVPLTSEVELPPIARIPEVIQGHVVRVSAGYDHAIALLRNGSVVTWGNDEFGQISDVPPEVMAGKVLAISAGYDFSLAIVDPVVAPSRPAEPLPPPGKCGDEAVCATCTSKVAWCKLPSCSNQDLLGRPCCRCCHCNSGLNRTHRSVCISNLLLFLGGVFKCQPFLALVCL